MTGKKQWSFGRYSFTVVPVTSKAGDWVITNDVFIYGKDTVGGAIIEGIERTPEMLSFLYMTYQHNCNVDVLDSTRSENVDQDAKLFEDAIDFRTWVGKTIRQNLDDDRISTALKVKPSSDIETLAEAALDWAGKNGTPDLLLYDVQRKAAGVDPGYQFVEVKAPGDRLSEEQKEWYRVFDSVFPVHLLWYEQIEEFDLEERYGIKI